MRHQFTLDFTHSEDHTFRLARTNFEELDDSGQPTRTKEMKSREQCTPRDWPIPDSDNVLRVALAFVRVAQARLIRITDVKGDDIPVLAEKSPKGIASKFITIRADATKPLAGDGHASQWVQNMFSLDGDAEGTHRLSDWFSVSQKRGLVSARRATFPAVIVMLDGSVAAEAELDALETHLSLKLAAGLPPHLEDEGYTLCGRPPSIQPGWCDQEQEAHEAEEAYLSGKSVLGVLGKTATGKTVFATYWLRRLIGTHRLKQKTVFSWSFNRQGVAYFVPVPLTMFFQALAEAMDVQLGATASPVEQANSLLRAFAEKPTALFLDGLEATFRVSQSGDATASRPEIPPGLAHLLRGVATCPGSFLLATSHGNFATPFGLPKDSVHLLHLERVPVEAVQESIQKYADDLATEASAPHRAEAEHPRANTVRRSVAENDHRRMLMRSSKCTSEKQLDALIAERTLLVASPEGYLPLPGPAFDAPTRDALNIFLHQIKDTPTEILFHILCTCHHTITEATLLSVASSLPVSQLYNLPTKPSQQDWHDALEFLITTGALEQAAEQNVYSVHSAKRRFIADGLKKNKPLAWIATNKSLGEALQVSVPWLPETHAQLAPLVDAAIHFCEAGDKRHAYHVIGFERLMRRLKAYAVFHLGEYEAARGINHALLGDAGDAAISDLPPEGPAMCLHVNAICLRFLDRLEDAFREERKAWVRAKATKISNAILPIGFNMLRLSHIFGELREVADVESTIRGVVFRSKFFGVREALDKEDIVDGASALCSMLALTQVYRSKWKLFVNRLLAAGAKECRNNGATFRFLMPTYGRPWHALVLLETGQWRTCEQAIESGEWGTDMVRYQQTGFYEWLAAKTFLEKAKTLSGKNRDKALATAKESADAAMAKVDPVGYRWWTSATSLTQGQIFAADAQPEPAQQCLERALQLSRESSFRLLTVDALLERATLAATAGQRFPLRRDATEALALSQQIGYRLREPALRELVKVG